MKKSYKIYLTPESQKKLKSKASALFPGRGSISKYVEKIANEPVAFLDENVLTVLTALNFRPETVPKV